MSESRSKCRLPRITLARLMIFVAVAAPFFLILREDEQAEMILGAMLVAGCVAGLTYKLASDAIRRATADGRPIHRGRRMGVMMISFLASFAIIASVDFAFFVGYEHYMEVTYPVFWVRRSHDPYHQSIQVLGLIEGTIAALALVKGCRLVFWLPAYLRKSFRQARADRK